MEIAWEIYEDMGWFIVKGTYKGRMFASYTDGRETAYKRQKLMNDVRRNFYALHKSRRSSTI